MEASAAVAVLLMMAPFAPCHDKMEKFTKLPSCGKVCPVATKFVLPISKTRFRGQHKIQAISEGKDVRLLIKVSQIKGRLIFLEGHGLFRVRRESVDLGIKQNRDFTNAHNFEFFRSEPHGARADCKGSRARHDDVFCGREGAEIEEANQSISWSTT